MSRALVDKKAADETVACGYETQTLRKLSVLNDSICMKTDELETDLLSVQNATDTTAQACAIRDKLLPGMKELRVFCDLAETRMPKQLWPYPSYADLLFSVK